MQAVLLERYHQIETLTDNKDVLSVVCEILSFCSEVLSERDTIAAAQTEMTLQFQQMKDELSGAKKENALLKKENIRLSDQLGLRKRDLYGRSTETTSAALKKAMAGESSEDPLDEDAAFGTTAIPDPGQASGHSGGSSGTGAEGHHRKKTVGKREADLSRLPKHTEFLLDIDGLNEQFGEGNWSIRSWTEYRTIESVRATKYIKSTFVPVISAGIEHELFRTPYAGKLLPGSLVSESLGAEVMYDKFTLGLPFYRIEADLARDGVFLSRTNMANWCIRFATDLFYVVYRYLCSLLVRSGYTQSDETTLQVINDGRKPGAVSYMWVHTTSELYSGNPIIVFCYELTRNTQHLRDFYLKQGYSGFITSDAYCSYGLLEKEAGGDITVCGCFMHSRRRFVMALLILDLKGKTDEYIETLPEYRAQMLLNAIYHADGPLKEVSPEERLRRRQSEVKPKVDAFFSYLHSLKESNDLSFTEYFRKAIDYSLNNEEQLRKFLEDASIPIDNGFCERSLKSLACARKSWLFCYSVEGAEAMAILYTLSETAKACGAHPYYYYKYLLDVLPHRKVGSDPKAMEELMPWSETYTVYEQRQKDEAVRFLADQAPVLPPKAPKQNRRPLLWPAS